MSDNNVTPIRKRNDSAAVTLITALVFLVALSPVIAAMLGVSVRVFRWAVGA